MPPLLRSSRCSPRVRSHGSPIERLDLPRSISRGQLPLLDAGRLDAAKLSPARARSNAARRLILIKIYLPACLSAARLAFSGWRQQVIMDSCSRVWRRFARFASPPKCSQRFSIKPPLMRLLIQLSLLPLDQLICFGQLESGPISESAAAATWIIILIESR